MRLVLYTLRVRVTARLLVVRGRKERVRDNSGIDGGMGTGGGIIMGFTGVETGRLKNGEKLRG